MELRTGIFESTLDEKGRIFIPIRLRETYSISELVITQGRQPSVWIMTSEMWERVLERLKNSSDLTEEEYSLVEYLHILPAQLAEIDKLGRIAVPQAIRKYAGLTKECLVLSAENRLEVWDSQFYYAYLNENSQVRQEAWKKMGSRKLFSME
jgi:MraZ protein